MRPPLRIAVLECGEPLEDTKKKYGTYGGVFEALLRASTVLLARPGELDPNTGLQISKWDIANDDKYPALEDIDAILITGSKYNSFDQDPWIIRLVEYTQKVLAQNRVRIIGVCFGHQIVGRALGNKVGRNKDGWEISVCDVNLTEKAKELFKLDTLRIQQMHQDIIYSYPQNVTPLGSSPRCEVQGMYLKGRFITIQGHPEFTDEIVTEIIHSRAQLGILTKEEAQDALARVGNRHDGVAVGAAFLRFLLED